MTTRIEPELALDEPERLRDRYGFPVVTCGRCAGVGRRGFNAVDGDRCYGCGGNGTVLAPEVARDVVAEFAAAQRAATRPKVRELKAGDVISKPYTNLEDAKFRHVVRVLVAPHRPTRFENREGTRRPVAFAAAIDYDDGGRDVVTTDFVYARRGSEVDPAPFVAKATRAHGKPQRARRTA